MRESDIRLYNCDFRRTLENEVGAKSFDIIATDPPYNIGFKYNSYSDSLSDEDYISMLAEFKRLPLAIIQYPEETIKYIAKALGVPSEIVVWCYNSNIGRQSRLISFYNTKVDFNAVRQPYKNPNDKKVRKLIAAGSKGTRLYDWFSDIQLVKNVSKEKSIHPCPVPVKLMERIILLTTKEGDTVFDPFMGGSTTAIACLNTGRHFIGCEIDKLYFKATERRIYKYKQNFLEDENDD